MKRYALVSLQGTSLNSIANYLPTNYKIAATVPQDKDSDDNLLYLGDCVLLEGRDDAGWTLDAYVLPRLGSGLIFGHEIDLSHPVMKTIPD